MKQKKTDDNEAYRFNVSFIITAYNSSLEDLLGTLESVVIQNGIDYEIIVADDGSRENHEKEIINFFKEHGFKDYKLAMSKTNRGTVKNLLSGLKLSEGYYIKDISPGDFLWKDTTICEWIAFMESEGADWSFSDAAYYYLVDGKKTRVMSRAHPQVIQPYKKGNDKRCRWNYVVQNDLALGAALLCKSKIMKEYMQLLSERGVVYAEDNMWRLLMFDGNVGAYYPEYTVLYECATGISNTGSEVWRKRLHHDRNATNDIMFSKIQPDGFQRKMIQAIKAERLIDKRFSVGKRVFGYRTTIWTRMT